MKKNKSKVKEDSAPIAPESKEGKLARTAILANKNWNADTYEYNPSFKPWDGGDIRGVHTTGEMLKALESDKSIVLDAKVLHLHKYADGIIRALPKRIGRESFTEGFKTDAAKGVRFREDGWTWGGGMDFGGFSNSGGSLVGRDFTPLLGGPFYKNLYFYTDYIRMHADAFYAYHNDPFAKAIVQITRDFVLGTGYDVQCEQGTPQGKLAMAAWKAFEEANDLHVQIDQAADEIAIYGEVMWWKLPGNQSKITYDLRAGESKPVGIIPRVRLIDPSNIVEIVTYPEDINRPLFYVWLQPTQWQIYSSPSTPELIGAGTPTQPTAKFIYRQIPAAEMLHFKVNAVSNEKRGRSDFFPIFNYLRRLRDSVHYSMIALEKVAAWAIDTTVEGDQSDIQNYIADQAALGTIPPPGSEFVHSAAIKRSYMGIQHAAAHSSDVFQWCLSCIAAGSGIPVSYFGTHLSGGTTKASALVATEPVAKKMEKRREVIKRMIKKLWATCMDSAGLPNIDCNVSFPEMISQDETQKLQNILLMEQARWISPERAATLAAKEIGIDNYSYPEEMKTIQKELPEIPMPLVDPGQIDPPKSMDPNQSSGGMKPPSNLTQGGALNQSAPTPTSGVTSTDKAQAKKNDRTL